VEVTHSRWTHRRTLEIMIPPRKYSLDKRERKRLGAQNLIEGTLRYWWHFSCALLRHGQRRVSSGHHNPGPGQRVVHAELQVLRANRHDECGALQREHHVLAGVGKDEGDALIAQLIHVVLEGLAEGAVDFCTRGGGVGVGGMCVGVWGGLARLFRDGVSGCDMCSCAAIPRHPRRQNKKLALISGDLEMVLTWAHLHVQNDHAYSLPARAPYGHLVLDVVLHHGQVAKE